MTVFFEELFKFGVYKRSQGRIVRQVTFAAIAVALLVGVWKLILLLRGVETCPTWVCYGVPALVAVVGLWAAYRSVNLPAFADFLIAVETEMNKVSWPSRGELFRWSGVVIIMIFAIGILLAGFDVFWIKFFTFIGVYRA